MKKICHYLLIYQLFVPARLFSHVGDPFLDDTLPREYVLYLRPTGPLAQKLSEFWQQSKQICGKNKAHNIFPHITLCQFFMVKHSSSPLSPLAIPLPGDFRFSGGIEGVLPWASGGGDCFFKLLFPGKSSSRRQNSHPLQPSSA